MPRPCERGLNNTAFASGNDNTAGSGAVCTVAPSLPRYDMPMPKVRPRGEVYFPLTYDRVAMKP
jgi:hypothetical protein